MHQAVRKRPVNISFPSHPLLAYNPTMPNHALWRTSHGVNAFRYNSPWLRDGSSLSLDRKALTNDEPSL